LGTKINPGANNFAGVKIAIFQRSPAKKCTLNMIPTAIKPMLIIG
jgi:hypothetical protein